MAEERLSKCQGHPSEKHLFSAHRVCQWCHRTRLEINHIELANALDMMIWYHAAFRKDAPPARDSEREDIAWAKQLVATARKNIT